MKNYMTKDNIAAAARMAGLCGLAVLGVGFSPAFSVMLSPDADISATSSALWASMIGQLRTIRDWLSAFGNCARFAIDQTISLS